MNKRAISAFALAVLLALCLALPALASERHGMRTELSFVHTLIQPTYFVTASVEKLTGNQNRLTITVAELYPDGRENVITNVFMIPNNAAGTYQVGEYQVYVDTKGNIQIRACYVVN